MKESRAAVIIPTYNRAHILPEAIESVLAQTFEQYELVIVDSRDGSTDATVDVTRDFRDSRIRYMRQENRGPADARNCGVAEVDTEYVAFLDSDDIWMPEKLERSVKFLDNHPETGGVFHDLKFQRGKNARPSFVAFHAAMREWLDGKQYPEGTVIPRRELYLILLQGLPVVPTGLVFRREAFRRCGSFMNVEAEDWDFLVRFARTSELGYIDLPLGVFRQSAESLHLQRASHNFSFVVALLEREHALIPPADLEALAAVRSGIKNHTKVIGWNHLEAGKRLSAISTYLTGFAKTRDAELLLRAFRSCLP